MKFQYEKPNNNTNMVLIIMALIILNAFIIWLIYYMIIISIVLIPIFIVLLLMFISADWYFYKLIKTYKNNGIIIDDGEIRFPFYYSFTSPKIKLKKAQIKNIEVNNEDFEYLKKFLNNNKIFFTNFHMVDFEEYNEDPENFLIIQYYDIQRIFIILRKEWLKGDLSKFEEYIHNIHD